MASASYRDNEPVRPGEAPSIGETREFTQLDRRFRGDRIEPVSKELVHQ